MKTLATTSLFVSVMFFAKHATAQHEGDIEVGVYASGQLGAFVPAESTLLDEIAPGNPFGLHGWSGEEPGFASLLVAEDDLNPLDPTADLWLEIVGLSPAMRVLDPSTFSDIGIGGTWSLEAVPFDTHPIWMVDSDDPAFDPGQGRWTVDWRLIDQGGSAYDASEVYSLSFVIPEPSTLASLAVGAALLLRRRPA